VVRAGGRLLVIDFAPHGLEFLREAHQHRRLGFSDVEIDRWLAAAGLETTATRDLPPADSHGLTVKIWTGSRQAERSRSAA
jgi:ArsR family transcriptional regulator